MDYSVSVVMPNYNGEDLLKKNLSHVLNLLTGEKYVKEIIIVDDGSLDNSLLYLQKFQKDNSSYKFKIIIHQKNQGFSSAVNDGVKEATGDIILLLNTDVVPEKGFLSPLLNHFSDPNLFAAGCMDKSIEGKSVILRGRGIGKWQRGLFVHARGEVDKKTTLWVSGGSGAFRKTFWEKLSGFNDLYNPFYWEDIDLSYRALKSDLRIVFEKNSTVIHQHHKGSIKSNYNDFNIKAIAYRNQFFFIWTNITDKDYLKSHYLYLPYHILTALLRLDTAFFYGLAMAFCHISSVLNIRKKNQKNFIKSDKEILNV